MSTDISNHSTEAAPLENQCPSCGAGLKYSAEHRKLSCGYCGFKEELDTSNDKVVEQNLNESLQKLRTYQPPKLEQVQFNCGNCGAIFIQLHDEVQANCGYCGSKNVNPSAYEQRFVEPHGMLPFYISKKEAAKQFEDWIKKGWFHPNKLKKLSVIENLHGVYVPFWTFDAQSEAHWSGDAGFYYYTTHQVRVNGRMTTQRRRHTRWERRSGNFRHFFDDILILASSILKQSTVQKIFPYRLNEVINFDPKLVIGWEAEVYQIELNQGHQKGEIIMDHRLRQMCSARLGGDTQRNLYVQSKKWDHTYKLLILPLWICTYIYNNNTYHFEINGQTGKVTGEKPLSYVKIAFAILFAISIILLIVWLRESGVLQ